jgi:hypothetical protein
MTESPTDNSLTDAQPPSGVGEPALPPPPAAEESPTPLKEAADSGTEINLRDVRSKQVMVAKELHVSYFGERVDSVTLPTFTLRHTIEVSAAMEEELDELFVKSDKIDNLVARLLRTRVLLISGASGIGKATTALFLGRSVANAVNLLPRIRVCKELERYVRIDLREVAADVSFASRVVILHDAFARGNRDLISFFSRADHLACDDLRERLEQNKSFLILTATSDITAFWQQLADRDIHHELSPPPDSDLASWIDRKFAYVQERRKDSHASIEQLKAQRDLLSKEFTTIPTLARFIDFYIRQPVSDLELAIRRFKDIGYWFRSELATNHDTWTFALSLGLTQATRDPAGIDWLPFDRFRRAVAETLCADLDLRRRDGVETDSLSEGVKQPISQKLADETILEHCHAEVRRSPVTLTDAVRFKDASYPSELWQVLLRHERRVLTALLPTLRRMATEPNGEAEQRTLAAQILGRMGELDPSRITLSLVEHWLLSADKRDRMFVGKLYQGVMGSSDERYRHVCLEELHALADPRSSITDGDVNDRLLTAIAAWSQIGELDVGLAMRELGSIGAARVAPLVRDGQRIERLMRRIESQLNAEREPERGVDLVIDHTLLDLLAFRIYAEQWGTFMAMQYAIHNVCVATDPITVIHEMRDWIARGGPATGLLVAFLFLQESGIAAQLEGIVVEIDPGNASITATTNPIVISYSASSGAVSQLAAFLADLYESINSPFTLPTDSQRYFLDSLMRRLTIWSSSAVNIPAFRAATLELFTTLSRIRGRKLFTQIYQLLDGHDFSSGSLRTLADEIRLSMAG